jgi:hypothetical protein
LSVACLALATACGGGGGSSPAAVQTAPSITTSPASVTINAGGSTTFTVAATGSGLTYQWQVSSNGTTFTNLSDGGVYGGSATAALAITGATAAMTGYKYDCVVSGSVAPPATSAAATLTVDSAPAITTQPADASISDGGNATFSVVATGTTLTYQWMVSTTGVSGTFANVGSGTSGGNTATLTVSAATVSMTGYAYECVVSGAVAPPATSAAAVLTVTAAAPSIVTQPVAATVTAGSNATFTVVATGTGLTYDWKVSTTGISGTFADVGSGGAGATLTVTATTTAMTGYAYECVVSGTLGSFLTTNPVLLTVDAMPTITSFTTNVWSLPAGGPVKFTAVFSNGTGGTALISPGNIDISSGTATANPSTPTTYTLTVKNSAGTPAAPPPALRVVAGSLTVLAGKPSGFGEVDGTGTAARFSFPAGLVYDASTHNLFVVDWGYNGALGATIREVVPATGVVTTFAGSPGIYAWQDGKGRAAFFSFPYTIASDGFGSFYVADTDNNCIRKIDSTGNVSTIAGDPGNSGSSNLPNPPYFGTFLQPYGVAAAFASAGNGTIYVADSGNNVIRTVTVSGGVTTAMSTLAGTANPNGGYTDSTIPSSVAFNYPIGICLDSTATNLYVADADNEAIRQVATASGVTTTLVPPSVGLIDPLDVVILGSNLYIADSVNAAIESVPLGLPVTSMITVAGTRGTFGNTDSPALFFDPTNLATDGVNIFVADSGNNTIRKIANPTTAPTVSTLAGFPETPGKASALPTTFFNPCNIAVGPITGNIYVADRAHSLIQVVTPAGVVNTFAGEAGSTGDLDGPALSATFKYPVGVAVDAAENVYVADTGNSAIRLVSGGGTTVSTIIGGNLGTGGGNTGATAILVPTALCLGPNGVVYVSNNGQGDIESLTPSAPGNPASSTWTAAVFAGIPGTLGYLDGASLSAEFSSPGGIVFDGAATFYVADTFNNNIRAIKGGNVSTLAGSTTGGIGSADGTGSAALFSSPTALAIDATATFLYVADTNNATVRRITIATGEVDTIVGSAAAPILETAPGALPATAVGQGVALDATHLYLATNDALLVTPY